MSKDGSWIGAAEKWREHWCSFDEAVAGLNRWEFAGLGYVFTDDDPFIGIDLDNCVAGGQWLDPLAKTISHAFKGTYQELSVGGNGIHILIRGEMSYSGRRTDGIEVYSSRRFFALTGRSNGCSQVLRMQDQLDTLLADRFPPPQSPVSPSLITSKATTEQAEQVICKAATNERSGADWARMFFAGRWEGYHSRSCADMAFIATITFFAGPNPDLIRKVAMMSQMTRPKWFNHPTYLSDTINAAISTQQHWYTGASPDAGKQQRPHAAPV